MSQLIVLSYVITLMNSLAKKKKCQSVCWLVPLCNLRDFSLLLLFRFPGLPRGGQSPLLFCLWVHAWSVLDPSQSLLQHQFSFYFNIFYIILFVFVEIHISILCIVLVHVFSTAGINLPEKRSPHSISTVMTMERQTCFLWQLRSCQVHQILQ